ncbi:uncharacterized protein PHACADRAFT_214959 [Phanerochaete carnosa HHB-10118-sp]|uniref:Flavodoxin-like domain-containing protein n=1 Tax=Phanerochaete carnosa (strain HHB-10118-sp) TaxID=650164 RepID=K5WD40_PHACS|nr:uncharacterized protein PHACADRAFT_214959 [Phanerochaete carnosa HHB-10118-sp]EKM48102.1 hypothetical protein PHACADRAFT_214959 [Phanerochaete carnosa HHB-10118-sp]
MNYRPCGLIPGNRPPTARTSASPIIVTASFEGQPAENAVHFVELFSNLQGERLSVASYAVLGRGRRDWVLKYQRMPTLCDDLLAERGGDAVSAHSESFEKWETVLRAVPNPKQGLGTVTMLECTVIVSR